jgi:hypothetical protein
MRDAPNRFCVRLSGRVLITTYPDVDSAKKAAQGHLLSRRNDTKAEVLPIIPNVIGGLGEPLWSVKKSRTGKLTWASGTATATPEE